MKTIQEKWKKDKKNSELEQKDTLIKKVGKGIQNLNKQERPKGIEDH